MVSPTKLGRRIWKPSDLTNPSSPIQSVSTRQRQPRMKAVLMKMSLCPACLAKSRSW
jgi:hypothetical protein